MVTRGIDGVSASAEMAGLRRPMDQERVRLACRQPQRWEIRTVVATGSTNDDLTAEILAFRSGIQVGVPAQDGPEPVLVTEEQTVGRGRSGRHWACPAGAGLMFSVAVAVPEIPPGRRGWIGAALGVAIIRALRRIDLPGREAGANGRDHVSSSLKWPNDVLVGGRKCAGILAEMTDDAVVVGAGINVSVRPDELPRADATSLVMAGARSVDRNLLLAAVLDEFGARMDRWRAADGDVDASGLRAEYLELCSTVGSQVRVELPGGRAVRGLAVDVDSDGAIVVQRSPGGRSKYSAGDVVHLRPDPAPGRQEPVG